MTPFNFDSEIVSVEKLVRKAHRRMTFWRLVGDLVEIPAKLLNITANVIVMTANALASIPQGLSSIIMSISRTVFYFELEYARQYRILTNTDLAVALGEAGRYGGVLPGRADAVQGQMFAETMEQLGGDEQPD